MKNLNMFITRSMLALTLGFVVSCNNGHQNPPKEVLALREQLETLLDNPEQIKSWATSLSSVYNNTTPVGDREQEFIKCAKEATACARRLVLKSRNVHLRSEECSDLKWFIRGGQTFLAYFYCAVIQTHRTNMALSSLDVEEAGKEIQRLFGSQYSARNNSLSKLKTTLFDLDVLVQSAVGRIANGKRVPDFCNRSRVMRDIEKSYPSIAPLVDDALCTWRELLMVTPSKDGAYIARPLIEDTEQGRIKFVKNATKIIFILSEVLKRAYEIPKFRKKLSE